jgi:hypothetical protein
LYKACKPGHEDLCRAERNCKLTSYCLEGVSADLDEYGFFRDYTSLLFTSLLAKLRRFLTWKSMIYVSSVVQRHILYTAVMVSVISWC